MYRQYQTNQQAWDKVTNRINEDKRQTAICQKMFGQDNLIGLTEQQREEYYKAI